MHVEEIQIPPEIRRAVRAELEVALRGWAPAIDDDWRAMARSGRAALLDGRLLDEPRTLTRSVLVLRSAIDVETAPPTPDSGFADDHTVAIIDMVLLGLCDLLGLAPIAYPFENAGRLARNVIPHPEFASVESSWGSEIGLQWHQDNNFLSFEFDISASSIAPMPRCLAFLAIRNHELVPTDLLAIDSILGRLPTEALAQLQRPAFAIAAPSSVAPSTAPSEPGAALVFRDGTAYARLDATAGMRGIDPDAARALELVRAAVDGAAADSMEITLHPGDIMVFDNYRIMHRRPPFESSGAAERRWLRRIYGLTKRSADAVG